MDTGSSLVRKSSVDGKYRKYATSNFERTDVIFLTTDFQINLQINGHLITYY